MRDPQLLLLKPMTDDDWVQWIDMAEAVEELDITGSTLVPNHLILAADATLQIDNGERQNLWSAMFLGFTIGLIFGAFCMVACLVEG